jgi:TonB family protein
LIGDPALHVKSPDMPNWGDPVSPLANGSSGPGQEGGIGDGLGGGIGNGGEGPGLGPGKGGGTGDGEFMAGGHGVGFPVCIYCPNPQYSEEAVKSKYQGVVLLLATITADGRVTNIRVSRGLGVGLDEMAIAAVRTWRFKPALGPDGKPVTVNAPIEVTFRLY